MPEIALTLIKVLFLALLWIFVLVVASVIRSDLFGRPMAQGAGAHRIENAPSAPKQGGGKRRKAKGQPRILVITAGPQTGTSADLGSGTILIGRGSDCQIALDDDYVSTRHARVMQSNQGGYYLEDLGSTNGSYVNGQRITTPTTITLADSVRIGKTVMRLEV